MQALVGIIRTAPELEQAIGKLAGFRERLARVRVEGNRQFNPGWHLALDLHSMLTVSEACARSALRREESRGGHTREDFPKPSAEWGRKNVVTRRGDDGLVLTTEPLPAMPDDLRALVEATE
jgi:succinate dehydrogenase / fumarate reductase flavoprotein subunit